LIAEARQGVITPNGDSFSRSSTRSGTPQSSTPSLSPVKSKANTMTDSKNMCDNNVTHTFFILHQLRFVILF
jgi:hypothetical protein